MENIHSINNAEKVEQYENRFLQPIYFSEAFEIKLLGLLLRNEAVASDLVPHLLPESFSKLWFQNMFRVIRDYYNSFNAMPKNPSQFLDHLRHLEASKKLHNIDKCFNKIEIIVSNIFELRIDDPEAITEYAYAYVRVDTTRRALGKAINLFDKGKFDTIGDIISEAVSIRIGGNTTNLSKHLQEKYERERQSEKELLGYPLDKFRTLARHLDGIQSGFYIIAAETSSGKTALATNLLVDILLTNPETSGLYFSLDDNKNVIINRMLGILSGLDLNQVQRKQHIALAQDLIADAYKTLLRLSDEGRLNIVDISETNDITTLETLIKKHPNRNSLVVVIDGLYNLTVSEKAENIRADNIDRANKIKALVDTYQIPIICTGELRKKMKSKQNADFTPDLSDMMETGKFSYNANAVLLLYPESRELYKLQEDPILVIDYGKNKLSHFKGVQKVTFKASRGIIEEIYESDSKSSERSKQAVLNALN